MTLIPTWCATALATLAVLVLPARAQDVDPAAHAVLSGLVEALRNSDEGALADLVDFELLLLEGEMRGQTERPWADLDSLEQLMARRQVVESWLGNDRQFLRDAVLYGSREIEDPNAGHGPVPDRRVFQVLVRNRRTRMLRDLLVTSTPDLRVVGLVFGRSYPLGANPAGEQGMLPEVFSGPTQAEPAWPPGTDQAERASIVDAIDELLAIPTMPEQAVLVEELHRSPYVSVTALLHRLTSEAADLDVDAQALLITALTHITGRSSVFTELRRNTNDETWETRNAAEITGWVRWHRKHGHTFQPAPIDNPLRPTLGELREGWTGGTEGLDRWAAALAGRDGEASDPGREVAAVTPRASDSKQPGEGGSASTGDAPIAPWRPPKRNILGLDRAAPEADKGPDPRLVLLEGTAELPLRFGSRKVKAGDIEQDLSEAQREALNTWAAFALEHELSVVLGDSADTLVLSAAKDKDTRAVAGWMDDVHALFEQAVPLVGNRVPAATIAIVVDRDAVREELWTDLIDQLLRRRMIVKTLADDLRTDPGGVTMRASATFIQLTFDVAGDAGAGDDEFRLHNEVLNKTTQCLLTARCGAMPPSIRWGLGYVAEIRQTEAVYLFDHTGFVASSDHFDWPVRTRQHLEKRRRMRDWKVSSDVATVDGSGQAMPSQMVTWGLMDFLVHDDPDALSGLLTNLAEVHQEADPRGRSVWWKGTKERTRLVLADHLDHVEEKALTSHLRNVN